MVRQVLRINLLGLGKAGIATIKGGKYVKSKNFLKLTLKIMLQKENIKKGTEKTVIKNLKQKEKTLKKSLFHFITNN